MLFGILRAVPHEHPDGSWRHVENIDPVFLNDLPDPIRSGKQRVPLVHDRGGPNDEGTVDSVAVPGYPPWINGTPEDIGLFDVKYPF